MAIYRIEAPDGKTYRLEGPAGASHDELIQALKAKFPYADLTTQELKDMPRAPGSLGDTARSGIAGLLGAVGSIASAAGAETEIARGIRKYGDEFIEGMTPARKEEMQREAEISRRAEGKGAVEEVKADVRSVTDAPVQAVAQGLGSSVPAIVAGLGVMAAGAPVTIAAGVALFAKLAIGALQGAGETKASIFDTVTQQLMEQKGLSRAEAEAEATKAQEYLGKNSLSILGGAGAGMLDSVLGVESIFGKAGKKAATRPLTQPSALRTAGKVAFEEALPEGIQGGVGKLAENIALQNAGIDTSTFQGVAGASVRDALMGALTGAAVSPLQYSNLRREYAQEKERKVEEEKAKIDEAVRKEEEELAAKTREADAELLAEPPREVKTPQNIHPIRNPLGNFSKEELQQGVPEAIDEYRKRMGLPALETYSIEDIVDAMPGIDPELEKKHIDNILTMRTGYEGDPLTADDIITQAKAKGISQDQAFEDFLLRTTGESDLKSMSQPQLYSAFKSINELPEDAELEEGTNAARFTDEQYKSAIDSLDKLIGEDKVLVSDALADIKISTGLSADRFAKSILDAAVRRGDFDRKGQSVTAPTTAEALPKGYEIQEGVFEKGEKPEGFQVKFGESLTDTVYATREEAEGRVEELTAAKGKVINQINNEIKQLENTIQREQSQLDQVAAMPNINGIEYKKYEATTKSKIKDLQKRIADLQGQITKLDPEVLEISVVPAPVRKVKAKGFTLFKDKSAIEMFKSREEAERAIVSKMSDKELASIVKAKGRRTLKKKAQEELDRRYLPKEEEVEVAPKEKPKAEFEPTLRALLDKFGLKDVALNIESDMKAGGEYSKSLIKIALDNANPVRTLRHESVHAMKELGMFTPKQWRTLENAAKSKWIDTYLKQRNINGDLLQEGQQSRYDAYMDVYGGDEDAIIEEAIADAFGDFDINKAPPGLMTALLKRLKLFFEALRNALTGAGFQTYEDVFGKAERGELVAAQPVVKPSEPKYDQTDAWQATPEERQEALEMYDKDGFLPYVSQGRLNIPIDDVKYSLQKFNPEKHLDFDSTLGVPINKDGTVTMYYHTTKAESLAINTSKVIPANGRSRIYLTNESSGAKVIPNKGNMEQEIDGSTVLVYVTPDMLQVDTKYEDGRVDLYIPVAQGEYFNKKMKQHSIQKARTEAIATEFSYEDHEKRITDSIQKYQAASQKERAAMLKQARQVLKREHNIGSLLTENGKLEKTRMGDYNLSYDGLPVASQGLGLASAQKITEKVSTCPRSSICEGLCLGETSGGNFMFGGAAAEDVGDIQKSAFRAGARMVQYLKTEALIVNPEAFAVLLQAEIDSLKRWSASPTVRKKNPETGKVGMVPKDIYAPAVRLNVTSDFKPSMFRGVIEGNEDVMFYDYTKINSDTIAPNHHITYSSTGFGQNVDGKPVYFTNKAGKYDHNWSTVRDRLNNGFNVAMAFSSKSALPKFLTDEKTGQTYRILDGDLYDARYLDQYSKEKEESGDLGVIVGLRNKAGNLSEKNATEKTQGFFVKYDPKTDGDTVVVPDQDQFKQIGARETIPIKKLSIREAPSFDMSDLPPPSEGKFVLKEGTRIYHGAHRARAEEIKAAGQKLLARPPYKSGGGMMDEGNLIWFGGKDLAEGHSKSEIDTLKAKYDEEKGLLRMEGDVFSALTDKDYSLVNRGKILTKEEANTLNNALQLPDYKKVKAGDALWQAARRAHDVSPVVDKWQVGSSGTMTDSLAKSLTALGYDGLYDGSGIALVAKEGIDIGQTPMKRYSLRDTPQFKNWFGDSKIVNKDGTPKVMYHGTARDITAFQPKQANAIFVTEDPKFAESFSDMSENYMAREFANQLDENPEEKQKLLVPLIDKAIKSKDLGTDKNSRGFIKTTREDHIKAYMKMPLYRGMNTVGLGEALTKKIKEMLPSNQNIMPVYVSAQNPFDYSNPDHIKTLAKQNKEYINPIKDEISRGSWMVIEAPATQKAIREAGFDGFYVVEGGKKNLAVYNPEQIKSATGNSGMYDKYNPDIRYDLRNSTDPTIRASTDRITTARDQRGFVERIVGALKDDDAWSKFRANALNRYNRLGEYDKRLVKLMGGAKLLADSSAEAAALMSDLGAGLTASALGVHDRIGGVPVYKNGVTTVSNLNNTVKGPVAIFAPLSKYGDPYIYQLYQLWAGAKRGRRLMADGREHVYTQTDFQNAAKLEKQYPEFVQIQKEWIKYNNGLVKFLVDTGVLSQDKADEFTKYSDYVPFYRQMEGDTTIGPNLFTSISGVKGPKKIKGGEAPLADFLETIVRNTQSSIQMGIKNVAAQRAADVAVKINEATRLPGVSSGAGVFTVLENGKLVYYQSSDELFINAIKSLNLPDLPFIGFFAAPANALRNLVTKDPAFMLANMVRDSMSAYVTSGANYKPVISTLSNFGKSVVGTSPEFNALLNAGLIGGYEFSQTTDQSSKTMEEAMRIKAGIRKFKDIPLGVWQALEKGTTASDAATRIEVYKSTMAETGNEAEALFRAMEVMNFNRKGSSAVVRVLTAAVPFLNARMQGLDVLYRAGISPTVRKLFGKDVAEPDVKLQKTFLVRGLTMMALSCMYWALTHDDDEYKKQEQEVRDNYWLIPALGVKIPTPFEVGLLFKTIPERIMEYSFGDDTGRDFMMAMKRQLQSTLMFNPIPQTVLPLYEVASNHSFFTGRDVVPQGMEDVASQFQVGPGTSLFAQMLAQPLGLSPIKVDHLIKGYTGTIGDYAVNLIDMVLDLNSNSPKVSKRIEQMPFIKRFMLDPEARGTVTAFYDLKNEVDKVTRTINLLERTTKLEDMGEYLTENINVLAVKDHIQDLEKDMKELREFKIVIRNSTSMTGDEKRDALLEITKLENNLTSNMQRLKKLASR